MTDPNNLVLEHLRAIRATLDNHTGELHTLGERMSAMEKHMGALISQLPPVWDEVGLIKKRLERIERRLELTDSVQLPPPNAPQVSG